MELARTLAGGARHAMAATKAWLNELEGSVPLELLERGAVLSTEVISGDEAQARLTKLFSA